MTQAEKAKRYDEALEKARSFYKRWDGISASDSNLVIAEVKEIFPELKESEDERIRKDLIEWFEEFPDSVWRGHHKKDILAWLEKQGEQKPIDNVEPTFKVGYWIVNNNTKNVFLIKSINNGYCTLEDIKGNIISPCLPPSENESHIWTIKDAKPGDVLTSSYGQPFIYNGYYDSFNVGAYGGLCSMGDDFMCSATGKYWTSNIGIHPATKEQRDILFKKMKKAGYRWDAEKKELKKIESNLTEFENTLADICRGWIGEEIGWEDYIIKNSLPLLELAKKQFDKCEQKLAKWSEEDEEYLNFLEKLLEILQIKSTENEIKKGTNSNSEYYYKVIQWLKSLKPKKQWKPTTVPDEAERRG